MAGAHRRGQRLQLHRPGGPDQGRRVGQLRHRRLPHAALPERRQHDAGLSGDHRELGRGGHHARQVGRLLLRHGLAGQRDLVLRVPPGLAAHRGLRRRLVRVEPGPGEQPDRDRRARTRRRHGTCTRPETRASSRGRIDDASRTDGRRTACGSASSAAADVARRHYLPALAGLADRVRYRVGHGRAARCGRGAGGGRSPTGRRTRARSTTSTRCSRAGGLDAVIDLAPAPRHGAVNQTILDAGCRALLGEADRRRRSPRPTA